MKVYISVDMEGASGIGAPQQCLEGDGNYGAGRKLLLSDVNAAVRGAVAGGGDEVVVNDGHNATLNLDVSDLDPAAELVVGSCKPLSMMEGFDGSFDLCLFIGYHAGIGVARGVLNHSFYPGTTVQGLFIDGRKVGETTLNGLLAASQGVPLGLVAGDDETAVEARELGARAVVVKRGLGRFSARCLHPRHTARLIEAAATDVTRRALAGELTCRQVPRPVTFTVRFTSTAMADVVCLIPLVEREDDQTVRFTVDDYPGAFRLYSAACAAAYGVRHHVY